jgi:hypothetical protein
VVYFHHLHVEKANKLSRPPDDEGNDCWEVEGKARRMLILKRCLWWRFDTAVNTNRPSGTNECLWYVVKARPGYLVLSLTSHCPPSRKNEHLCLGKGVLDIGEPTFVELKPVCYPSEIVCHGEGQRVHKLNETLFEHIEKEIMFRNLGWYPA